MGTSAVSRFTLLHLADAHALNLELFRFDLGLIALTAGSNDLQAMFRVIWRWLRGARESVVSCFIFSPWFVVEMLDLELYRFNLDSIVTTAGSNNPNGTFGREFGWLCDVHTS